jgi:hypothetical protein
MGGTCFNALFLLLQIAFQAPVNSFMHGAWDNTLGHVIGCGGGK